MGSVLQKCYRSSKIREDIVIEEIAILKVLEGICEDMKDMDDINTLKSMIRLCHKLHLMKFSKANDLRNPYYLG